MAPKVTKRVKEIVLVAKAARKRSVVR